METYFVPYSADAPAAVNIKGHTVLIVSTQVDDMLPALEAVGGDEIRRIDLQSDEEVPEILADLAANVNGGVVLTPPGVSPTDMIENLAAELPWIH